VSSAGRPIDEGRRAFLRGTLFTSSGRARLRRSSERLGPAPPWLGPHLDEQTCGDCAAPCLEACEPAVLLRHETGHDLAGLPYLSFGGGGCTSCGDCVDACPLPVERQGNHPPLGTARLDAATCLAANGVTCISCLGPCDEKALARDPRGRISVVESACSGCGACVAPCPVGALSVRFPA